MSEFLDISPKPELPWRFKAYSELAALRPELKAAFKNSYYDRYQHQPNPRIDASLESNSTVTFNNDEQHPMNFSSLGADSVTLEGITFPYRDGNSLIRISLNAFKDGSPLTAEGDEIHGSNAYDVYFGAEMPPFAVNTSYIEVYADSRDFFAGKGFSLTELISGMENKHFLTDEECEKLVGLIAKSEVRA